MEYADAFTAESFRFAVKLQVALHEIDPQAAEIKQLFDTAEAHVARGEEHVLDVLRALDPNTLIYQDNQGAYHVRDTSRMDQEVVVLKLWTLARCAVPTLDRQATKILADYHGITVYFGYETPLIYCREPHLPTGAFDSTNEQVKAIAEVIVHLTGLPAPVVQKRMTTFNGTHAVDLSIRRLNSSSRWNHYRLHAATSTG